MDILTIIGVVVGLAALLGGQALEGGHVGSIMQLTAALIVLGGTFGAVMVQFPLPKFIEGLLMGLDVLKAPPNNGPKLIETLVDYANLVRKQGILALEAKMKDAEDHFLKKGLQLLLDGTEPKAIREILELEVSYAEEFRHMSIKMYEAFGGYAPTFGIIGAVMGLIHVMENLADPSMLGSGIAVAFVATIYGVLSANLIFLPVANKLKMRTRMEAVSHELVIEGLISIASGENPRLLQEKLAGFLDRHQRAGLKKI
ncbi:MAG: flagellar motor protein [Nitrospirota bacterium]